VTLELAPAQVVLQLVPEPVVISWPDLLAEWDQGDDGEFSESS
jgi:hypothetical protein